MPDWFTEYRLIRHMHWTFRDLDEQPQYRIDQLVEAMNLEAETADG